MSTVAPLVSGGGMPAVIAVTTEEPPVDPESGRAFAALFRDMAGGSQPRTGAPPADAGEEAPATGGRAQGRETPADLRASLEVAGGEADPVEGDVIAALLAQLSARLAELQAAIAAPGERTAVGEGEATPADAATKDTDEAGEEGVAAVLVAATLARPPVAVSVVPPRQAAPPARTIATPPAQVPVETIDGVSDADGRAATPTEAPPPVVAPRQPALRPGDLPTTAAAAAIVAERGPLDATLEAPVLRRSPERAAPPAPRGLTVAATFADAPGIAGRAPLAAEVSAPRTYLEPLGGLDPERVALALPDDQPVEANGAPVAEPALRRASVTAVTAVATTGDAKGGDTAAAPAPDAEAASAPADPPPPLGRQIFQAITDAVAAHVGAPRPAGTVAAVAHPAGGPTRTVDMAIDLPDLGRVTLRVWLNDSALRLRMTAGNAEAVRRLQDERAALTTMLRVAGYEPDVLPVNVQAPDGFAGMAGGQSAPGSGAQANSTSGGASGGAPGWTLDGETQGSNAEAVDPGGDVRLGALYV
jgi:hypothetical protein